jgi:hypothetical protein
MGTILVVAHPESQEAGVVPELQRHGYAAIAAGTVPHVQEQLVVNTDCEALWLNHDVFGPGVGIRFMGWLRSQSMWRTLPVFIVASALNPEDESVYRRYGVIECYSTVCWSAEHIAQDVLEQLYMLTVTAAAR